MCLITIGSSSVLAVHVIGPSDARLFYGDIIAIEGKTESIIVESIGNGSTGTGNSVGIKSSRIIPCHSFLHIRISNIRIADLGIRRSYYVAKQLSVALRLNVSSMVLVEVIKPIEQIDWGIHGGRKVKTYGAASVSSAESTLRRVIIDCFFGCCSHDSKHVYGDGKHEHSSH